MVILSSLAESSLLFSVLQSSSSSSSSSSSGGGSNNNKDSSGKNDSSHHHHHHLLLLSLLGEINRRLSVALSTGSIRFDDVETNEENLNVWMKDKENHGWNSLVQRGSHCIILVGHIREKIYSGDFDSGDTRRALEEIIQAINTFRADLNSEYGDSSFFRAKLLVMMVGHCENVARGLILWIGVFEERSEIIITTTTTGESVFSQKERRIMSVNNVMKCLLDANGAALALKPGISETLMIWTLEFVDRGINIIDQKRLLEEEGRGWVSLLQDKTENNSDPDRQTTSFIDKSIEGGILSGENSNSDPKVVLDIILKDRPDCLGYAMKCYDDLLLLLKGNETITIIPEMIINLSQNEMWFRSSCINIHEIILSGSDFSRSNQFFLEMLRIALFNNHALVISVIAWTQILKEIREMTLLFECGRVNIDSLNNDLKPRLYEVFKKIINPSNSVCIDFMFFQQIMKEIYSLQKSAAHIGGTFCE